VHAATGGGDLTVQVGLFGAPDPELRVDAAETAFAANDMIAARIAAADAVKLVGGLAETGRTRVTAAATGAVAIVVVGFMLVVILVRRRRRRRALAHALPSRPEASAWYATLAASRPGTDERAAGDDGPTVPDTAPGDDR
jgi:hypothetical protein